ncbi:hypothetical protein [uncultured Shewanella sp.]
MIFSIFSSNTSICDYIDHDKTLIKLRIFPYYIIFLHFQNNLVFCQCN